jgi:DNA polymerase I-like protein with 3'-5' exonuclease and polymerase domains
LNCSIEDKKQAKKIKEIMENTVELKVPLKVDTKIGPSWGEIN